VLSNLVSNVPAVLMLKPFVDALTGSIANLIVVQRAGASGVVISFWDYFRVGAPLTIITLAIGTLWLWL
jgi:Na+/H+ antiporter NhaD/arsenite permease-like protein